MEDIVARIVGNLETDTPVSLSFLRDLETLLDYTCSGDDPVDLDNLYSELSSRNVSPTSLTNLISSGMDSSLGVNTSILAAKVYLLLLSAPNSPVFMLFSPIHYLGLLRAIRLAIKNPLLVSKEGSVQHSHGRKRKKGKNVGGNKSRVDNAEDMEIDGREGGLDVKELFSVLQKLEVVLGLSHLDRFPDCLKALVQTVSDMPKMVTEFQENFGELGRLCELCLRILGESLKPEHGDQGETAAVVLKSITPPILSSKSQARSFSLGFVVGRMARMAANSSGIKEKVANLPKYLAVNAPERAEGRALAVESIMEIVKCLDSEDQVRFAEYVENMSQGKAQLRLLSVDLILNFTTSPRCPFGFDVVDEGVERPLGLRLLETLIERCSDSAAVIRARALTNLAQVVGTLLGNDNNRLFLKGALGFGNEGRGQMNDILKRRCMDEKAAVRKAALLLLSKLSALLAGELDEEMLKTVGMACSDPLVSIRKVAVSALSEAFRTHSSCLVTREWLHSVPRLVNDNETSIQEESENLFLELVIDRVSKVANYNNSVLGDTKGKKDSMDMRDEFPEGILELLKEICDGEVSPWVKKICLSLGRKKKLKPKIAVALRNIISASESRWLSHGGPIEKWTAPPGAWFLLSEVSAFLSKAVDWEFLHHHWLLLDKCEPIEHKSPLEHGNTYGETVDVENNSVAWVGDRVFLLQTISNVSVELPPEPAAELAHNILEILEGFDMHSTEVNAHVKALRTLCKRKARNTEEADSIVMRWVDQLLSKASHALDLYMSRISGNSKDTGFLTPPTSARSSTHKSVSKLSKPAITAIYTIGSLVIVCPSANLKSIVPVIHTIITSGTSDPKSSKLPRPTAPLNQTNPSLYIQAWLTMGKVCLADGKLAKCYIPLFVQELEKSDSAALRNNIVVMMTDFCVRYTALVDCYMSKITKCLRDPCELVRRQTFILLSRLLQRDYVKWRGVLFLRFLLCLVDDSEKISQLADFLFGNILKAKAPLLAYNSFVEAVFVLNDCNAHTGRANLNNSRNESRLFAIRGNDEKSRSQRMYIYVTLLKQMSPEHLLATFTKVCAEILAAASDGMLSLDDSTSQSVLRDAFFILSSKEIRIQPNRGSSSDAADIEEDGENSAGTSKGRAITQVVRKGLIQNTIPIFIELKRLLESKNSPLMGSLMDCLRIILKEYKNDIDDILVADQQLRKELIYDMEKYESMKATTKAAQAVATMHRSERSPPNVLNEQKSNLIKSKLAEKLRSNCKVASAVADAVAAATARSVLRDVTNGLASPLSAMGVPKLKSQTKGGSHGGMSGGSRPKEVIQSLRRQFFASDEDK